MAPPGDDQRGCLAMLATGQGIILRISANRGREVPSIRSRPQALAEFAQDALAGDPVAREAFQFAGRVLGTAVANHINASLPPRVKVVLLHPEMAGLIAAAFYAAVQENTLAAFRGRAPVELTATSPVPYLHGAAAMVLEQLYSMAGAQRLEAAP